MPSVARYSVDRRNRLVVAEGPRAMRVAREGIWRMTPRHELTFTTEGRPGAGREVIRFTGEIVKAGVSTLVFALHRTEDAQRPADTRLALRGRWQAVAGNRLSFLAEAQRGAARRIVLQGAWHVGPHHELAYRYQRRGASGIHEHALAFDGVWDIPAAGRLAYRVSGGPASVFEFDARLQRRAVAASDGRLAFEIGIRLAGGRRVVRRVALFGQWRVKPDLSVDFEVPYAGGRIEPVRFQAAYRLTSRNRLAASLSAGGGAGRALGLTVTFTRQLVADAELFLRLRRAAGDTAIMGGIQLRF